MQIPVKEVLVGCGLKPDFKRFLRLFAYFLTLNLFRICSDMFVEESLSTSRPRQFRLSVLLLDDCLGFSEFSLEFVT